MHSDIRNEVRLIAIPPAELSVRELVDHALAAERGGATSLQVRLKNQPASVVLAACEQLLRTLSIPVYVNDRADVARLAGAAGVHVGADDLDPGCVREILPRPFRIGISVGSTMEAAQAQNADVDYWSLGPFAPTPTKADAGPALGIEGFRELGAQAPPGMPVVAIGGINVKNAADAITAGACGVAVINALFGAEDVEQAARTLRRVIDDATR